MLNDLKDIPSILTSYDVVIIYFWLIIRNFLACAVITYTTIQGNRLAAEKNKNDVGVCTTTNNILDNENDLFWL